MPELARLGGGAFAIALPNQHESGGFHVFDESDRRAPGVDVRVVVNRSTEIGNHPLVDVVFPVVALPVGDSGSGDGGAEASGLGDGPHGHVSAVAPTGEANTILIDRGGV